MSFTSGLRRPVFVFLFLSIIGYARGVITNLPLNAVTEVGQQAIFNCTSDRTLQNWAMTTKREDLGTAAAVDIAVNCVVQPGFVTHYEVDRPGGNINICNLIVKDVTMQQAGIYTCSDTVYGPSAILTVIDSSPMITYNNTPDVMEGEKVVITCTLNYNGPVEPASTLRPHFYWTDYTGNNVSSFYNSTPVNGPAISQIQHTAGRQDITPFTCHVYLQLISSATPGYVTNTPSVNSSASSPPITVLYPVEAVSIISTVPPKDKCVSKLETLTCTADANPPAQYVWTDLKNNITTTGAVVSISSGGDYQCIASNNIRNQIYYETKNVTEINCFAPPTKLTTPPLSTTDATTVCTSNCDVTTDVAIAMGVLFAISLVVDAILLIIMIRRQDSSKRKENIPEPQTPYHSDSFPPTAYEELRRNDGIHLQPTTYEQLTHRPPLYENHVS